MELPIDPQGAQQVREPCEIVLEEPSDRDSHVLLVGVKAIRPLDEPLGRGLLLHEMREVLGVATLHIEAFRVAAAAQRRTRARS